MKNYNWTIATVQEFGSPDKSVSIARSFVRKHNGLWYKQCADAKGQPEKGAGMLFNPTTFVIGQTSCRKNLESLGFWDEETLKRVAKLPVTMWLIDQHKVYREKLSPELLESFQGMLKHEPTCLQRSN